MTYDMKISRDPTTFNSYMSTTVPTGYDTYATTNSSQIRLSPLASIRPSDTSPGYSLSVPQSAAFTAAPRQSEQPRLESHLRESHLRETLQRLSHHHHSEVMKSAPVATRSERRAPATDLEYVGHPEPVIYPVSGPANVVYDIYDVDTPEQVRASEWWPIAFHYTSYE